MFKLNDKYAEQKAGFEWVAYERVEQIYGYKDITSEKLKAAINTIREKAEEMKKEYKCEYPVKFEKELFEYEGKAYYIYPSDIGVSSKGAENGLFEHIMFDCGEDILAEIGAEKIFCCATID